jgi:Uma2 family endonuclease
MIEAGVFGPEDRLELLNGEIIDMAPQRSRHATAVTLLGDALRAVFGRGVIIRVQLPFSLNADSQPEPDVAVVAGNPRDYRDAHPGRALLICEVSDTSLAYDRGEKLCAYARAGIPEYWILDLTSGTLEVCRTPTDGGYADRRMVSADARVAPIARPGSALAVGELLP